jgi:hypothetical protein
MNIVKLQNDLKDLSDRQLLDSMQMGSAPQYLVLAEMQRRKKMRDNVQQEQQPQGSVAEEIMGGIAQLPAQSMEQMASGGLVSFARGGETSGYAKGLKEACWTDPNTGEEKCPPSKTTMLEPVKKAEGGIVALQAGGTPSEARSMLAARGVDTTGMSDEEVMGIAATHAGVMVPNVDVAEPTPTEFMVAPNQNATVENLQSVPATPPEPAPKAEPNFFEKGLGALANTILPVADLREPVQSKMEEVKPEPAPAPKAQPYVPMIDEFGISDPEQEAADLEARAKKQREVGAIGKAQALEEQATEIRQGPQPDVGEITDQIEERIKDATGGRLYLFGEPPGTEQRQWHAERARELHAQLRAMTDNKDAQLEADRLEKKYPALIGGVTDEEQIREIRQGKVEPPSKQKQIDAQNAASERVNQYLAERTAATEGPVDDLTKLYREIQSERKTAKEDAKGRATNEALMRMGLAMMASKNPDFFGALGEAGIEGLKGAKESREAQAAAEKLYLGEVGDLLAARELSASKAITAQTAKAESIRKSIDFLKDMPINSDDDLKERDYRIAMLQKEYDTLMQIGGGGVGYGVMPQGYDPSRFVTRPAQ